MKNTKPLVNVILCKKKKKINGSKQSFFSVGQVQDFTFVHKLLLATATRRLGQAEISHLMSARGVDRNIQRFRIYSCDVSEARWNECVCACGDSGRD